MKHMKEVTPPCFQHRYSCVSNKNGFCLILTDTHFNRDCPFYMDVLDVKKQKKSQENEYDE